MPFLEELGWEFVFWTPAPGTAHTELAARGYVCAGEPRLLRYGWRALKAPPGTAARVRSLPGYIRRFRQWLRSQSPSIVHANTLITIPEAVAAHRTDFPTVLHVHEILPEGPRGAMAARLMKSAVDTVLAPSEAAARALRRANVPVRVINYGVPLPPLASDRAGKGQPLVVGTVGTISKRKGSDCFLAAAGRVRERMPNVTFRMIGGYPPAPERAWAESVVERARSSEVEYGTRTNIFDELAGWDLFVLPSREDPFPLAVLEAMAAGLPVVATRVGGIPEQVTPETGVLVGPDDPDALAAEIVKLAARPDLRAAMGAAARRRAEHELTLERQAEHLHQAYLATLGSANGSG